MKYVELLLLFSVFLQSVENLKIKNSASNIFVQTCKIILISILLFQSRIEFWCLLLIAQGFSLAQFRGNLNGGSDAMTTISLVCMTLMNSASEQFQKVGFYYLSVQVIFSYFIAGLVKLKEPDWRSGRALGKFLDQAFYQDEFLGRILQKKFLLKPISRLMLFWEITFPIILFVPKLTVIYLFLGFVFHLMNSFVFGLHRFFWAWIATYPVLGYFLSK